MPKGRIQKGEQSECHPGEPGIGGLECGQNDGGEPEGK